MKKVYMINGWRYGKRYFYGVRRWSVSEIERMENGETIVKDGDEFRIIVED